MQSFQMETKSKAHYFDQIQVLRGVAAIMVVFHHSIGSLKYYHQISNPFLDLIGFVGRFGVDFFFVLSGFIITISANGKYGTSNSLKNYIINRVIRIYIPYLPIGIVMFLLCHFLSQYSNGNRLISTLTSLTLIPDGNPALSVAWTLTFEMFFYIVFCISFLSKKAWNYFVVFWCVIIIYFNYTETNLFNQQNSFMKILLSTYNLEFILGYILACLIITKVKIKPIFLWFSLLLFLSIFIFLKLKKIGYFYFDLNLIFVCVSFIIIYISILYDKKLNKKAIMMLIGNATYSIYLVHNPLQMIVIRMLPKINSQISSVLTLLLVILLSVGVGYLYSFIFEKKLISIIKAKLSL